MPAGFWIFDGFSIDYRHLWNENTYKDRRKDISNFDFFLSVVRDIFRKKFTHGTTYYTLHHAWPWGILDTRMHPLGETSGNEGRQSISPVVRISKLNKRRRPPKEGRSITDDEQRRMSLSSSAAEFSSASKRSRVLHNDGSSNDEGAATASSVHCKENMLNGRPAVHARASNEDGGGGDRLDNLAPLHCHAGDSTTTTMAGIHPHSAMKIETIKSSSSSTSVLGFIDGMDKTALMPAITSLLGINLSMYQSPALFQRHLERSFECNMKYADNTSSRPNISQMDDQNAVHHNILGRIDPPSVVDTSATTRLRPKEDSDEPSFAFPQCKSSQLQQHLRNEDYRFGLSQHSNHQRRSGHGMCLPSSWYRFPTVSKIQSTHSETDSLHHNIDVGGKNGTMHLEQESKSNSMCSSSGGFLVTCDDERQNTEMNTKQPSTPLPRSKVLTPPTKSSALKYQGKIRIDTDRGATIREVFDIEKSNVVIGKLNLGDERYYLEKKILPPPPISLLDESDDDEHDESDYDDDDDECVAVVRYKICLNDSDLDESQSGDNPLVGWISDRGRLANDPYLILREI